MTLQKQYEVVDMTIIIATQTLLYSAPDFFFLLCFSCGAFVYTNSCLKLGHALFLDIESGALPVRIQSTHIRSSTLPYHSIF